MNYNHLTIEERCCIRKYYNEGKSFRAYYPHTAQRKYSLRRKFCHRGMFWNNEILDYIEDKLNKTWSPEQIAKTPCEIKMPSFKTIYRWIYEGYLVKGNVKVLRKRGKTRKRLGNGGRYTTGKSIRKRDKSVYKRQEVGHWEADTVVSGIGKSKACFATFAERKTRYYIAVWMPDRKAESMEKAAIKALGNLPSEMVKSITCDRGSEFGNWQNMEHKLKCYVYFADPYCAWQKGTNENSNGLTLKKNLALINARPKKVLGYKTPVDLFEQELQKVLHLV